MGSNDPNLLQMPEVVMGHILDKLDIPDVFILRKTCHHLRNLIADLHPDPKIVSTVIKVDPDSIEFQLNFGKGEDLYPEGKLTKIVYGPVEDAPDVCRIQWFRSDGTRESCVEADDFIAEFCRNFELIFGGHSIFQFSRKTKKPSTIQDFTLNLRYFPEEHVHWDAVTRRLLSSMASTLTDRPRPLPVKEFYTTVFDKFQVLQMLPCFQPKTLEKISIHYTVEYGCWFLNGLVDMEQWRMAKVLWVFDTILSGDIRKFKRFEEINIKRGKVEVREILLLKRAILHSGTNLTAGRVRFSACDGEQYFQVNFDDPLTDNDENSDERKSWFFEIPNKKSVLRISFYYSCLKFAVLEIKDLPENARVIREE